MTKIVFLLEWCGVRKGFMQWIKFDRKKMLQIFQQREGEIKY